MNKEMVKNKKIVLVFSIVLLFGVLLFGLISTATPSSDDATILYGWNSSAGEFDPVGVNSDGSLKTDLNSSDFWDNFDTPADIQYLDFGTGFWDKDVNIGANDFSVATNILFADSDNGRVGIGTTSPSAKLDVDGNINANGKVKENGNDLVPSGVIVMWSGTINDIPSGWSLCNGTDGTPDLTDRFVMGVSSSSEDPGATGGASSYTLTTSQLPSHTHGSGSLETGTAGGHNHDYDRSSSRDDWGDATAYANYGRHTASTSTDGAHTHSISGSTSSTGSGDSIDNRPSFYKIAYICKD